MTRRRPWGELNAKQLAEYRRRGLKCSLWGKSAARMTRFQLQAFVGALDECASERAKSPRWPGK